jgi:hypothetical protein
VALVVLFRLTFRWFQLLLVVPVALEVLFRLKFRWFQLLLAVLVVLVALAALPLKSLALGYLAGLEDLVVRSALVVP